MSASRETLWRRISRMIRIRTMIYNATSSYTDILLKCSRHAEDLYDKRILRRYGYNDTIKLVRTANEEIRRLRSTPMRELLRRGTVGRLRPLISLVDRIVFYIGMPRVSDILEYMVAPALPEEHREWMEHIATPCLISRERGLCKRLFFRSVPLTNPNSYVDNQCVWASIPLRKEYHIGVKLVIGRDPTNLIQRGFSSRVRILDKSHRSLLWAIHPRQIVVSSTSELRLRIQSLIRTRERVGKTPVGKLINEFLSADTSRQVTLFCSLCIPEKVCKHLIHPTVNTDDGSHSRTPSHTTDPDENPRDYSNIENPFQTKDKIPRSPEYMNRLHFKNRRPANITEESDSTDDDTDVNDWFDTSEDDVDSEYDPDDSMAPLLSTMYDLVANHGVVNRRDVTDAIDLLPWEVQRRIRLSRDHVIPKQPISEQEIPNETRLQILPIDESTKRVVYSRIREANSRGGDSSTKAASWVSGFFRIPFGVYRKEPVLMRQEKTLNTIQESLKGESIYGFHDIIRILKRDYGDMLDIKSDQRGVFWSDYVVQHALRSVPGSETLSEIAKDMGADIAGHVTTTTLRRYLSVDDRVDATDFYAHITSRGGVFPNDSTCSHIGEILNRWYSHRAKLAEALKGTRNVLNKCVRFQENAKDHVMRIIGQWMVGRDSGYCLGFEGPPGVGKTTLAREGLAKILKDDNGSPRPFRMIALGTATTGSSLVGHNYTYQSSQWGDIVRILMECECMNPIIYVDELDKVSQTENGREIISILTHLTDPAQNEEFQDRYFAGVKLDMSRVLFVFSYNDPSRIDPILLDRIHRIRFSPLTTHEKIQVIRHHTLPDIATDLCLPIEDGSPGEFVVGDEVIREVIHRYTNEAGLRKIKEILQDTFREVNLNMIYAGNSHIETESGKNAVTLDFIEDKVLHGRHRMNISLVDNNPSPTHTRVYGMFATGSGVGGVLPIRVSEDYGAKDPSSFPIRVTGSLGDVMKESVSIARTVCLWLHRSLGLELPAKGVHIHFPEGATPKDGPSAGSAICLALFAFSRGVPVPGDITITGEIDIDGAVLQVGGIPEKLTGAKRAGASRSIIPDDNQRDLRILRERIPVTELPDEVTPVTHIHDVLQIVYGEGWKDLVISGGITE